jgi:hypothetical protein
MAVIINEFEIVTSAEPGPRAPGPAPAAPKGREPPPRPQDLERVARHLHQRRERLRAD